MICGLYIPPNASKSVLYLLDQTKTTIKVEVSVSHFAASRSSYNFVDSDVFLPERWLAPGVQGFDARFSNDEKGMLQPFSTEPKNYLGMRRVNMASLNTEED